MLTGVAAELDRHIGEAEREVERHNDARRRHAQLVYTLGIPAGTLAVAAGSTALAGLPPGWTALIAFTSAAATTAMAVIDPLAGRIDHGKKEADFADFARHVRLTRLRIADRDSEEQFEALGEINARRHELDDRNPVRQIGPGGQPNG